VISQFRFSFSRAGAADRSRAAGLHASSPSESPRSKNNGNTVAHYLMKKLLWLSIIGAGCLCLCTSSVHATGAAILAGPVYNPVTTHTYFLLTSSDWTDAEAAAVSMGGHLVTINDAAENDWVVSTFSNFGGQPRALWTGLNDAQNEGAFVWSSGEEVTYTHWEIGQPDNGSVYYPSENYTMIWPSPGPRSPGYWNDAQNEVNMVDFSFQLYGVVEVSGANNWISPTSGKWETVPDWSLGKLPAADQVVNIANDGYKAVNIDVTTVANYPSSLTVGSLGVAAPTNALSTLLLNYLGTGIPLKVLNSCLIGTNGTLLNLASSFEVDNNAGGGLTIAGGTFTQQGGQTVVNGPVAVPYGSVNTTNANLTLGQVRVGSGTGNPDPYNPDAVFTQDGGSIAAQSVDIEQGGRYQLVSGILYGINGTTCTGGPFWQYGGTNYGDIATLNYYYWLRGGMVQGNVLTAGNDAGFVQDAGLLDMKFINVSGTTNWPTIGGPGLNGGIVHCGTLNIGGNGKIDLRGADVFVTNNFDLHGMYFNTSHGPVIEHAACSMHGGHLYLPSMSLGQYGDFFQDGGSNLISGGLSMSGGQYSLYGSLLDTTYTGVGAAATFVHGGGQHLVHGVLSIAGTYALSGARPQGGSSLVCEGLYLRGAMTMTMYDNGRFFDPPATITNTGVLNLGGTISTELPDAELGQVQLATNTLIDLSVRFPAVVRFRNSSALGWTAGALLVITNWSSSDHVFAGNDASGLSASQLQQVRFINPGGFAPGTYPARILATGEVVPVAPPTLQSSRSGNQLVLTWPSGSYQLLSSTNVTGPYQPVSGATSPYTINMRTDPQRFFRLQGQ
jgi:hypothetical protein